MKPKKPFPKIVRLLARKTRAASNEPSKKFGAVTILGPFKAHYDFTLELDNGERYRIGLMTDDPPDVEWFQKHFRERPAVYQKLSS